jgi:hypothetical protein
MAAIFVTSFSFSGILPPVALPHWSARWMHLSAFQSAPEIHRNRCWQKPGNGNATAFQPLWF